MSGGAVVEHPALTHQPPHVLLLSQPVRRVRGLNFGLASAPTLFGRVPRLATQLLRRVLAVVVTSFYDDFCVCEPAFAGASGQEAFWDTMELFGLPLAVEKHVPPAERFIFLGVQADFAGLQRTGVMTLGVTPERQDDVADAMEFFLDTGFLSTAEAARLCGRMVFVSMWSAGRWGRAPLRPILDVLTLRVGRPRGVGFRARYAARSNSSSKLYGGGSTRASSRSSTRLPAPRSASIRTRCTRTAFCPASASSYLCHPGTGNPRESCTLVTRFRPLFSTVSSLRGSGSTLDSSSYLRRSRRTRLSRRCWPGNRLSTLWTTRARLRRW